MTVAGATQLVIRTVFRSEEVAMRWLVVVVVVCCTACGAGGGTPGERPTPTSGSGATVRSLPTSTTTTSGDPRCHPRSLRIDTTAEPAPICLRVGDELSLTSAPSRVQPWTPLTSNAPAVLRCTSHTAPDGAIAGTCVALTEGRAALATRTSPFAGDPHGPPQFGWRVSVTVVGRHH